jgi:hypothetical protein
MPRRKPAGWPCYMIAKRLRAGCTGYFWNLPTWAVKAGCPMAREALGTDYGEAKRRCDELLNPQFDAWRTRAQAPAESARALQGTFDWLAGIFKSSPKYTGKPQKTRKSYDAALRLVSTFKLKDGRSFGSLTLASITPGAADRLYEKLRLVREPVVDHGGEPIVGNDGTPVTRERVRNRTALLAMQVCRRAWFVARRDKPSVVPAQNPFAKMELSYKPKATRPVGCESLMKFVAATDEAGESSLGTAAMIAFFWLQRETDIIGRLSWHHYRPKEAPDVARVWHHKTGELVDVPLYDDDGTALWPELMARLDGAPRLGTLIVMRDSPDRRRKVHLPWKEDYFRHRIAAHRDRAGLDPDEKFMGLRRGGNTEGADAELTDAQLRALSGHKTAAMVHLYAKATMKQRRAGARKRLDARTKGAALSE